MATRLRWIVVDTTDLVAAARFWSGALGWASGAADEPETGYLAIHAPWSDDDVRGLLLQQVAEPKTGQNRIHLDLASASTEEQDATVERLLELGAVPADIGQRDVPWVVLADPHGNELCVLEPRDTYRGLDPIAAVVIAAREPHRLGRFWSAVTGWSLAEEGDGYVGLRSTTHAHLPFLELVRSDVPDHGKGRVHLDVEPGPGSDQATEVERLLTVGAHRVDIGQGDVDWVVLADPEGNELCVLPEA